MDLWSLVKHSFSSDLDKTWIRFCENKSKIFQKLTFGQALEISDEIVKSLEGLDRIGVLGFMFDEDTSEVLGYFPALIAAIRLSLPFYSIRDEERYREELEKIRCRVVLSGRELAPESQLIRSDVRVFLNQLNDIEERTDTGDVAYIIQTSGTTGEPKPILVSNSSILPNIQDFNAAFQLNKNDVVFLSSPLTFDPSIIDIFLSLVSGAQLLVVKTSEKIKQDLYSTLLIENRVSVLQCTPSLLQNIFRPQTSVINRISSPSMIVKPTVEKTSLRILAVGGEKCSFQVREILQRLCTEGTAVYQLYGLTEMSVWQSMVKLEPKEIETMPVYIKGRNLITQTQIQCEEDAIIIYSKTRNCRNKDGISLSYIETGDLGEWRGDDLIWVGRSDNIIKIHGRKISLERMEETLSRVLETQIVCAVSENVESISAFLIYMEKWSQVERILERCREHLESWQIPQNIVFLNEFPVNKHGKINRKILFKTPAVSQNISGDSVSWFSELWFKLLNKSPGLTDNFISSGGDSFLAVLVYNIMVERIPGLYPTFLQEILSAQFGALCETIAQAQSRKNSIVIEDKISNDSNQQFEPRAFKKIKLDVRENREIKIKGLFRLKGRESCPRSFSDSSSSPIGFRQDWKVDFEKCIDSSSLLLRVGEKNRVVVGSHSGWVKCIEVEDGEVVWATRLSDRVEGSPSTDFSSIYIGCYDNHVYSLSLSTGEVEWRFKTQGIVKCTPLIHNGFIYFGSYDKSCYKLNTCGEFIWKIKISDGSIYSSPIQMSNGFVLATLDGVIALISFSGDTLWRLNLGHPVFSTPLWDGNQLYVASVDKFIYAVSDTGSIVWKVETGSPIFSSPILYKSNLLLGSNDGYVYNITPGGEINWRTDLSHPVFSSIDFDPDGRILCATTDGSILVLDSSGRILIREKVPGNVFSSPIFHSDSFIVGCRDNFLYSFKKTQ